VVTRLATFRRSEECGGYGPVAERCKANLMVWNAHSGRSDSVGCSCRGGSGFRYGSRRRLREAGRQ
jgi:hypothetical protein